MHLVKRVSLLIFSLLFVLNIFSTTKIESFGTNSTNQISITINETDDKIKLTYLITQTFTEDSRGIFLVLPKNQDGVWTEYDLTEVKKLKTNKNVNDESLFQDEKYAFIKEWNQLRLRIGDKDAVLPYGQYQYLIKIEAEKEKDTKYDFTLIEDWVDPVENIIVKKDNINLCIKEIKCEQDLTKIAINPDKSEASIINRAWNFTWIYFISVVLIYGLIIFLFYKFAKDPSEGHIEDSPEFEPPKKLYPWQSQFLINEGKLQLKDVLLSYILWLNNQKYIKITADLTDKKDEVTIKILKDLPKNTHLPEIFNKAVELMAEKGVNKGLLESKINPGQDENSLNQTVYQSLKKFYSVKPLRLAFLWTFLTLIFGFVISLIVFSVLQELILLGDSWLAVIFLTLAASLPGVYLLFKNWGKLTKDGYKIKAYSSRYKYYINKAEKLKLDFTNNPKEGVQYYLDAVPYAAAFGVLPKFQKYIEDNLPEIKEVSTTNSLLGSYSAASFYTPPSSSSGGGYSGGSSGGFSGGGGSW